MAVAAALLALAGCGGDDGDDGPAGRPEPTPRADARAPVQEWERAIQRQSCRLYAPTALTATRHQSARPGGPPVVDECRHYERQMPRWRGIRVARTERLGTVLLGEGPGPRQGPYTNHTTIFVLDWDRRFRFFGANASEPQIGTTPRRGVDFQASADAFVEAVRRRDCRAFLRHAMPGGAFFRGARRPQDACRAVFQGRNLAPQLAADRDAEPRALGETLDLGVFGVATRRNYYTLLVGTRPTDAPAGQFRGKARALVIDYFPNYRPS
jgi:hypothetical protein